jgi:hypothetical protein
MKNSKECTDSWKIDSLNEDSLTAAWHVHEMSKESTTETTLKLLIEQIYIVWEQRTNWVITLLSLNVANVFDTMSYIRLIHDMRKRKVSSWINDWISNFLFDRFTIFAVNRKTIESFSMQIEISHNFSLFSILYLYYNVDLLKMCNKF